jgi:hypothetical protein
MTGMTSTALREMRILKHLFDGAAGLGKKNLGMVLSYELAAASPDRWPFALSFQERQDAI